MVGTSLELLQQGLRNCFYLKAPIPHLAHKETKSRGRAASCLHFVFVSFLLDQITAYLCSRNVNPSRRIYLKTGDTYHSSPKTEVTEIRVTVASHCLLLQCPVPDFQQGTRKISSHCPKPAGSRNSRTSQTDHTMLRSPSQAGEIRPWKLGCPLK